MVESMSTKGLVAFYRAASGDLQFFCLVSALLAAR